MTGIGIQYLWSRSFIFWCYTQSWVSQQVCYASQSDHVLQGLATLPNIKICAVKNWNLTTFILVRWSIHCEFLVFTVKHNTRWVAFTAMPTVFWSWSSTLINHRLTMSCSSHTTVSICQIYKAWTLAFLFNFLFLFLFFILEFRVRVRVMSQSHTVTHQSYYMTHSQ